MKKKLVFFTGSRADYGLMRDIIINIQRKTKVKNNVIVSGSHLSKKFGYTINEIILDKIKNIKSIQILQKKSDDINIANNFSLAVKKISNLLNVSKPSLLVLLGDRYEVLAAAVSAMICRIPIAHIHGGEVINYLYINGEKKLETKSNFLNKEVHGTGCALSTSILCNLVNGSSLEKACIESHKLLYGLVQNSTKTSGQNIIDFST